MIYEETAGHLLCSKILNLQREHLLNDTEETKLHFFKLPPNLLGTLLYMLEHSRNSPRSAGCWKLTSFSPLSIWPSAEGLVRLARFIDFVWLILLTCLTDFVNMLGWFCLLAQWILPDWFDDWFFLLAWLFYYFHWFCQHVWLTVFSLLALLVNLLDYLIGFDNMPCWFCLLAWLTDFAYLLDRLTAYVYFFESKKWKIFLKTKSFF